MIYSDLNYDLSLNSEGELDLKIDLDAIRQSIKNIILSRRGARTKYQDPDFGCGVFNLLGEKINSASALLLKTEITTALDNYEPRIEVLEIDVDIDVANINQYNVLIKYKVVSLDLIDELEIDLQLIK